MSELVKIALTPAQASTLWWLLQGTMGATEDRGLDRCCREISRKLDRAGVDRGVEYRRQKRKR